MSERLRRSMLFVPGNNPGMIRDAHIYGSDSIMFDLEDSVAITEKDTARFLVYKALTTLNYGKKELVVRINDLSSGIGIMDLEAIVRARPDVIRLPKTETAQDVIDCEREIEPADGCWRLPELWQAVLPTSLCFTHPGLVVLLVSDPRAIVEDFL